MALISSSYNARADHGASFADDDGRRARIVGLRGTGAHMGRNVVDRFASAAAPPRRLVRRRSSRGAFASSVKRPISRPTELIVQNTPPG